MAWARLVRAAAAALVLAIIGQATAAPGLEAAVVIRPGPDGLVGGRPLDEVVRDIRMQVASGERRGPELRHLLDASGLDGRRPLPLPFSAVGRGNLPSTTAEPIQEAEAQVTTRRPSTTWGGVPVRIGPPVPRRRNAWRPKVPPKGVPVRLLLTTPSPRKAAEQTRLRGVMILPPNAYGDYGGSHIEGIGSHGGAQPATRDRRARRHRDRLVVRDGEDDELYECSGGICVQRGGDGSAVFVPEPA